MPTRRGVLKLIGGGSVLAAGSAGAFTLTNGPSKSAREAWREAGLETEYRRRALSYALARAEPSQSPALDGEAGGRRCTHVLLRSGSPLTCD